MASRMKPAAERRAYDRVPHSARAVISTAHGELAANVVDLSAGGLGVETTHPLVPGEFVRVRLPLGSDDGEVWVDPDALVVRVEPRPIHGKTRAGLSFYDLPADTLRRLVDSMSPARRAPTPEPMRPLPPRARADPAAERQALRDAVRPPPSGFLTVLANFFRRRAVSAHRERTRPEPSKAPPAAPTPPAARGELRDLFRSALDDVDEKARAAKPPKTRS